MQERKNETAQPSVEGSPFSGEELMDAVQRARVRVIGPRMRAAGLSRWAEDVAGDVAASAWKSRKGFDPRVGALQSWVNRIAHHRCSDRIDAGSRAVTVICWRSGVGGAECRRADGASGG